MTTPRPHFSWEWRRLTPVVRSRFTRGLLITACSLLIGSSAIAQLEEPLDSGGNGSQASSLDAPRAVESSHSDSPPRDDVDVSVKLQRVGSIALRDANLGDWLFAIRKEWGINIVYSSNDVKNDLVNGEFRDATLQEIRKRPG